MISRSLKEIVSTPSALLSPSAVMTRLFGSGGFTLKLRFPLEKMSFAVWESIVLNFSAYTDGLGFKLGAKFLFFKS